MSFGVWNNHPQPNQCINSFYFVFDRMSICSLLLFFFPPPLIDRAPGEVASGFVENDFVMESSSLEFRVFGSEIDGDSFGVNNVKGEICMFCTQPPGGDWT